ncbi:hypothetical protein Tco_0469471 [Tanacetum coccineum]
MIFNQVRRTKVMTRALEMIPLAPSSSGMHVPRAIFVDLEPTDIDEVGNRRIRILAFRMLVRGLREKAQTWLQYLLVSTGVNLSCRAIQQCAIKSFPIKTYYCLAESQGLAFEIQKMKFTLLVCFSKGGYSHMADYMWLCQESRARKG